MKLWLSEDQRLCLLCKSKAIENETHFVFECDYYNEERLKPENVTNVTFAHLDNKSKFEHVFDHPFALGKYLKSAFKKRNEFLYRTVC